MTLHDEVSVSRAAEAARDEEPLPDLANHCGLSEPGGRSRPGREAGEMHVNPPMVSVSRAAEAARDLLHGGDDRRLAVSQ